ncbi:MAG: hypothetical protein H6585_08925 [Flavobacteriales bacterium]|nr:hypothetical protein [Flavobacteriales bacterium]MCB9448452.1 hypothetical protein [Flavobacteriales bacterium]
MKTSLSWVAAGCMALAIVSCKAPQTVTTGTSGSMRHSGDSMLYRQAVAASIYPEPSKVDSHLVAIRPENTGLVRETEDGETYILVATWKQNVSYYEKYLDSAFYDTGNYPIWVTTVPELSERMQKEHASDPDRRLKQLLGLPPNATYSYFVEFWVKPEDLFRPCPDPEVNDSVCETCFPKDVSEAHKFWINENRISRYYQCELYNQYPWSQLGYTYDWSPNNPTHIGLSEFVIGAHKKIKVHKIYTTEEYLGKN